MDTLIYALLALCYVVILAMGWSRVRSRGLFSAAHIVLIVAFGLFYDNAIIALGGWIGAGPLLQTLSELRYWTHALFTPMLVLFALHVLRQAEISFAYALPTVAAAWLITIGLVGYQLFQAAIPETASLVPAWEYGALRYVPQHSPGGPLMVIIASGLLMLAGIVLWVRERWPWMALGVSVLFIGRAIPMPIESSALTNIFELILIISLWATVRHQDNAGIRPQQAAAA